MYKWEKHLNILVFNHISILFQLNVYLNSLYGNWTTTIQISTCRNTTDFTGIETEFSLSFLSMLDSKSNPWSAGCMQLSPAHTAAAVCPEPSWQQPCPIQQHSPVPQHQPNVNALRRPNQGWNQSTGRVQHGANSSYDRSICAFWYTGWTQTYGVHPIKNIALSSAFPYKFL